MRDAFGGAFLIKIMLIFLGVYISFMAVAMNYAKAFRVKNQVINIIEQYEGHGIAARDRISEYMQGIGYYVDITERYESDSKEATRCTSPGYCVTKRGSNKGTYFLVTTYVHLELPFFGIKFDLPVQGETRAIEYRNGSELEV